MCVYMRIEESALLYNIYTWAVCEYVFRTITSNCDWARGTFWWTCQYARRTCAISQHYTPSALQCAPPTPLPSVNVHPCWMYSTAPASMTRLYMRVQNIIDRVSREQVCMWIGSKVIKAQSSRARYSVMLYSDSIYKYRRIYMYMILLCNICYRSEECSCGVTESAIILC